MPSSTETSLLAQSAAGRGQRVLFSLAAAAIVIGGMRMAEPVLVPFALAVVLVVTLAPMISLLRRVHVPFYVAIVCTMVGALTALGALGGLVLRSLREVQATLPQYIARFADLESQVVAFLSARGLDVEVGAWHALFEIEKLVAHIGGALRGAASATSLVFIIVLSAGFMLAETRDLPARLRALNACGHDLQRYTRIVREVQRYLALKSAISLATGLLVGIWCWILGLDFAFLWGLLAFLLNYVPVIGSVLAAIPAIMLALVQLGLSGAVFTAGGYLVINMLLSNIIEPSVMGRGLGLSPVVVILSLMFWGFVWGAAGMLLSIPLTMALKIVLENSTDFRAVAVLLGPTAGENGLAPSGQVGQPAAPS